MGPDTFFDDIAEGAVVETGGYTVTQSDIIDFASRYDPQPFHIDAQAAHASPFGGLIASGFQTLAVAFRLFLDTGVLAKCGLGGPAMDEVRWLRPVRPGDTLSARVTATEVRASRSKPDRGSVRWAFDIRNQAGETVATALITAIMRRRPSASPTPS
jgi:acyl dehydratase